MLSRAEQNEAVARETIASGGVHVDGKRQKNPAALLVVGAKVVVHARQVATTDEPVEQPIVRHRDEVIAVVDKPAGLLSQAVAAESAATLEAWIRKHLGPDAVAMHRLDRETSGLVLVALDPGVRASLTEALAAHRIARTYVAIVNKVDQVPERIELRIAKDSGDTRRRRTLPTADLAGEAAVTHVRLLASTATRSALLLSLETGRTHQIRVHLAAIGSPIVGDALYGGPDASTSRLLLHAARLRLKHPTNHRTVTVESPLPAAVTAEVPNLIF